jgi:hypothetical protein
MGSLIEDFLDVLSTNFNIPLIPHVDIVNHGVTLVEDEKLELVELEVFSFTN